MLETMTHKDYLAKDACSSSRLIALQQSPAHCKHVIDNPREDTPALLFGRLVHALTFFGGAQDEFAIFEGARRQGKAWEDFAARNKHKDIVKQEEFETAKKVADAVRNHPTVGKFFEKAEFEQSLIKEDSEHGILCKIRPDVVHLKAGAVLDLKTTTDASPESFCRTIYNFSYYIQAAFYLRMLQQDGYEINRFVVIAVEKEPPYGVGLYHLLPSYITYGKKQVGKLIEKYAQCYRRNEWPGYSTAVEDIGLPDWVKEEV